MEYIRTTICCLPRHAPSPLMTRYFHRLLFYVSLHFTNVAIIYIKKISVLRLFRVATKRLFPLIIVPADCFKDIAIVNKHIVRNGGRE